MTSFSLFTFMHRRRKWQPTPVFLPREPQILRGLVGCHLWRGTGSASTEPLSSCSSIISPIKNLPKPNGTHYFLLQRRKVKSENEVTQLCLTPSDPMDCSLPGSSVHEIFQARGLEWVASAFSILLGKGKVYASPQLTLLSHSFFVYSSIHASSIYFVQTVKERNN